MKPITVRFLLSACASSASGLGWGTLAWTAWTTPPRWGGLGTLILTHVAYHLAPSAADLRAAAKEFGECGAKMEAQRKQLAEETKMAVAAGQLLTDLLGHKGLRR